ncbi:unnamed protein product [Toxocara canis]|uniref:Secreted protein n=1 Tax=Toxocara canis TaxID=6265 RepID=A0A183USS4_TOXCA|nr:unnamed protein product [Toxocara canis]
MDGNTESVTSLLGLAVVFLVNTKGPTLGRKKPPSPHLRSTIITINSILPNARLKPHINFWPDFACRGRAPPLLSSLTKKQVDGTGRK